MKKFVFAGFAFITFILAFTYLVSCLTPYVSPVDFWPMAFLALGFPYLAAVILILAFIWVLVKRKVALVLFLLLFAGFQNLVSTIALNPSSKTAVSKDSSSLRILSWNVRGFDNPSIGSDSLTSARTQMFKYISEINPDVLCLQEFVQHYLPGTFSNTEDLRKLGYGYMYLTNDVVNKNPGGVIITCSAIFSKIPIVDSAKVLLGDPSYTEYLGAVDIAFQNKKMRIFTTHFKSINLFAGPASSRNKVLFYGDSNFVYESTRFEKLKAFAQAHSKEAVIAKDALNNSPYPVIFAADMNSVPTSYPYHLMSQHLQDPFTKKGWGLGTTMDGYPKSLRIDFLLVDKQFTISNFRKDDVYLSDHFPQFVDVSWKK